MRAALFTLTACSPKPPSKDALVGKLKTESLFKTLNDKQVGCIADVLLKYASAKDLSAYVDGKKKVEDVRGPKDKEQAVTTEVTACATAA